MTSENGTTNGNHTANGNGGELTGLQRAFVDAWFACRYNGTEAARQAGYQGDDKSLAATASRTLRMVKVRQEIAARFAAHGATSEEALAHLTEWMRFDPAVLFDEHGRIKWDEVRKHGRMVKRISFVAGQGYNVEVHDQMKAAELIAKFAMAEQGRAAGNGYTILIDI